MEDRIRCALSGLLGEEIAMAATLDNLGGHASLRIYWRIHLPTPQDSLRGENTLMAMVLPEGDAALKSDEGGSASDPTPTELPFVAVQRFLVDLGMRVPAIESIDMELGVLLLEDLGDEMFENKYLANPQDAEPLYQEALDLLISFQVATGTSTDKDCICWQKSFDEELLSWELDHYREWGLDMQYGEDALGAHRGNLKGIFDRIVQDLLALPTSLSLRDFQSRNIMWKKDEWVLIDFQDALMGPYIYDVVALLRDSYIELNPNQVDALVKYYTRAGAAAGLPWCENEADVLRAFHLQTLQRKLKDAGRFIFIDQVKGNPDFLPYYKPSIGYVKNALENLGSEYSDLADILKAVDFAW